MLAKLLQQTDLSCPPELHLSLQSSQPPTPSGPLQIDAELSIPIQMLISASATHGVSVGRFVGS